MLLDSVPEISKQMIFQQDCAVRLTTGASTLMGLYSTWFGLNLNCTTVGACMNAQDMSVDY